MVTVSQALAAERPYLTEVNFLGDAQSIWTTSTGELTGVPDDCRAGWAEGAEDRL